MRKYILLSTVAFSLLTGCNQQNPTPLEESSSNANTTTQESSPNPQQTYDAQPTATPGFKILSSIPSHKGDQVVIAEISECTYQGESYEEAKTSCNRNFEYQLLVHSVSTGEQKTIYKISYPHVSNLIPTAQAGGCPRVESPFAWSKNDQKILTKKNTPILCGSGIEDDYVVSTIPAQGGDVEGLAVSKPLFTEDYGFVFYLDSEEPISLCSPGYGYNQIIQKEVETGERAVILEENSFLNLQSLDETLKTLDYQISLDPTLEDSCEEFVNQDWEWAEREITVTL